MGGEVRVAGRLSFGHSITEAVWQTVDYYSARDIRKARM
jgi:hypothetical protein